MKTAAKVLIGFAIIIAVALGAGYWLVQNQASQLAQSTVTEATGSDALGSLASKVMRGEDLSDSEIQSALGVDSATYQKVKEAASEAGIDLNDSDQLQDLATKNAGSLGEIESIADAVRSGSMSESEAAQELESIVQR